MDETDILLGVLGETEEGEGRTGEMAGSPGIGDMECLGLPAQGCGCKKSGGRSYVSRAGPAEVQNKQNCHRLHQSSWKEPTACF